MFSHPFNVDFVLPGIWDYTIKLTKLAVAHEYGFSRQFSRPFHTGMHFFQAVSPRQHYKYMQGSAVTTNTFDMPYKIRILKVHTQN